MTAAPGLAPEPEAWLAPFLPALRAADGPALELGCGTGTDAAWMVAHGLRVVACDRDAAQLARARVVAAGVPLLRVNIAAPLPVRAGACGAVVASLSLHYFPWAVTQAVVREVRRVLRPGGPFAFRVNASDDALHGANEGEEIEPGLRFIPSGPNARWSANRLKRFFDADAVRAMLADDFAVAHLAHRTTSVYGVPKRVWECLAVRR